MRVMELVPIKGPSHLFGVTSCLLRSAFPVASPPTPTRKPALQQQNGHLGPWVHFLRDLHTALPVRGQVDEDVGAPDLDGLLHTSAGLLLPRYTPSDNLRHVVGTLAC